MPLDVIKVEFSFTQIYLYDPDTHGDLPILYSGPCDLRSLHLTIPSIIRPAISDTILIFST